MDTPSFDSNMFYRVTNAALGSSYSLNVADAAIGFLNGWVDVIPTASNSRQYWQILSLDKNNGSFSLVSSFFGPGKKLDIAINHNMIWVPFVKNITESHVQTWNISSAGNSTYTLAPNRISATKFLSANSTTKQPFMEDLGGENQEWVLTPVMEINNASFPISASVASSSFTTMTTPSINSIAISTRTSTPLTSTASTIPPTIATATATAAAVASNTSNSFTMPKSALAAIIVAPITLFVVLVLFGTIIFGLRRRARQCAQTANISRPLMDASTSQVTLDPQPPPPRSPSSQFAASMISSDEAAQMPYPVFSPLTPRPPLQRQPSWEERGLQTFWGSSALRIDEGLPSPLSPGPGPRLEAGPVELPAAAVIITRSPPSEVSPLSSHGSLHELESQTTSGQSNERSFRRPVSLISRWKV